MEAAEHAALVSLGGRHAHVEAGLEAVEAVATVGAQLVAPAGVPACIGRSRGDHAEIAGRSQPVAPAGVLQEEDDVKQLSS